jgi:hypothetical protein
VKHLNEEELTLAYYDEIDAEMREHIRRCVDCQAALERVEALLRSLPPIEVPERDESYGEAVWARLQPLLPDAALLPKKPAGVRRSWFNWWTMAPALATLLAVAFFAGMLAQRQRQAPGIPAAARERVLLLAMSDHLDRSQILLSELVHSSYGAGQLRGEQQQARDLVDENRLLRSTAASSGNLAQAALLDELERVLLDVANQPDGLSAAELDTLRKRIEAQSLLFKVRIVGANARREGQRL